MNISVLATRTGQFGGVQRYGAAVCAALESAGHTIMLWESGDWPSRTRRVAGMARVVKGTFGADLIWALHPRLCMAALTAGRICGVPVVVSTYGFETWGNYARSCRMSLRRANVVTVISKFSASLMGDPGLRAVMLRPTSQIGFDRTVPMRPQHERTSILFVGRLDEEYKGVDIVVELAERLSLDPQWTFNIAGSGGVASRLRERIAIQTNLHLTVEPSDSELGRLYADAAIVLLPSRAIRHNRNRWEGGEGFGIVLLEAALSGATVVASDEGACPETVALLGNGFVGPPVTDEFEGLVRTLVNDPELRSTLARRGLAAAEHFSVIAFREQIDYVLAVAMDSSHAGNDGPVKKRQGV